MYNLQELYNYIDLDQIASTFRTIALNIANLHSEELSGNILFAIVHARCRRYVH